MRTLCPQPCYINLHLSSSLSTEPSASISEVVLHCMAFVAVVAAEAACWMLCSKPGEDTNLFDDHWLVARAVACPQILSDEALNDCRTSLPAPQGHIYMIHMPDMRKRHPPLIYCYLYYYYLVIVTCAVVSICGGNNSWRMCTLRPIDAASQRQIQYLLV